MVGGVMEDTLLDFGVKEAVFSFLFTQSYEIDTRLDWAIVMKVQVNELKVRQGLTEENGTNNQNGKWNI